MLTLHSNCHTHTLPPAKRPAGNGSRKWRAMEESNRGMETGYQGGQLRRAMEADSLHRLHTNTPNCACSEHWWV